MSGRRTSRSAGDCADPRAWPPPRPCSHCRSGPQPVRSPSLRSAAWPCPRSENRKSQSAAACRFRRTEKSLCFSPRTNSPVFASRATTLVSTSSAFIFRTKPPCGVVETCPLGVAAERSAQAPAAGSSATTPRAATTATDFCASANISNCPNSPARRPANSASTAGRANSALQNLNLAINWNDRIAPTDVTWPNVGEATFVSTPEYCTVLNTLLIVARISMLRVSPSFIVFESAMLLVIVPGPAIELRGALPKTSHGYATIGARRRIGRGIEPLLQRSASCGDGSTRIQIRPQRTGRAAGDARNFGSIVGIERRSGRKRVSSRRLKTLQECATPLRWSPRICPGRTAIRTDKSRSPCGAVETRVPFLGVQILPVLRATPCWSPTELASSIECEYW